MASLIFAVAATLTIIITLAILQAAAASAENALETYIVHAPAQRMPSLFASYHSWHASLVASAVTSSSASSPSEVEVEVEEERILYSYSSTLQGFAARFTAPEAARLQQLDGVERLLKDRRSRLHTTRSPAFLGLDTQSGGLLSAGKGGKDVIVGVLDTGIWPEHRSFADDHGFSPIPARWKGTCENSSSFDPSVTCNRKLIGARTFFKGAEASSGPINETIEFKSPRDSEGHGTHTSSTAAGSGVPSANLSGFADGFASGISPKSRLAVYKVCWSSGCWDSDLLAAFESAIADGVDIISLSVGSDPTDYYNDAIAIGAFAAVSKGIVVSCSAGNSGPDERSVTNVAPWIFTVAASSIDRDFPAAAVLGIKESFKGESLFASKVMPKISPLVYAGNAVVDGGNTTLASLCADPALFNKSLVQGAIVFCDRGGGIARVLKGFVVQQAGGAAMILGNDEASGNELVADAHVLPATLVGHEDALTIKEYISTDPYPTASIDFQGTKLGTKPAPAVTSFSSRGPNPITPEILKPDITAPGLNILAAWTGFAGPTGIPEDTRLVEFNIISGTSMSCPHVAGVSALLKGALPKWSPAAIRSALMTSAQTTDNTGMIITDESTEKAAYPTAFGAGHIHPNAALKPGLIYDITPEDYVGFLCSLGYTDSMLSVFVSSYDCSKSSISKPGDLNYPSFSAVFDQNVSSTYTSTFTRTVTNVGFPNSTYTVSVVNPQYVNVSVQPTSLAFKYAYQKLSYMVTLSAEMLYFIPEDPQEALSFGSLVWSDGYHKVQSPISFMWQG
ncbi:hypothetical protein L7F22_053030 [Adiantum nelumboides]|nr:hypothetical protein [Adiantum nelumboides]